MHKSEVLLASPGEKSPYGRAVSLVERAVQNGAVRHPSGVGWVWPMHGTCESPAHVTRYLAGHPNLTVTLCVRCRHCESCGRSRRAYWAFRADTEIRESQRTWLVTLTYGRAGRELLKGLAAEDGEGGVPCRLVRDRVSLDLSKYLDRVRHRAPGVRYVAALELHKDSVPHWHLLIHERPPIVARKRHLVEPWVHGFRHASLVRDASAASYVSKYLAKSILRVRASPAYGGPERN